MNAVNACDSVLKFLFYLFFILTQFHIRYLNTRNLPVGKGRPARKADNLTAIYEPIV
jgi:hypothetical protein